MARWPTGTPGCEGFAAWDARRRPWSSVGSLLVASAIQPRGEITADEQQSQRAVVQTDYHYDVFGLMPDTSVLIVVRKAIITTSQGADSLPRTDSEETRAFGLGSAYPTETDYAQFSTVMLAGASGEYRYNGLPKLD